MIMNIMIMNIMIMNIMIITIISLIYIIYGRPDGRTAGRPSQADLLDGLEGWPAEVQATPPGTGTSG